MEGSCHLSFGQTIHKVFEEYLLCYKHNLELPQLDLFGQKPQITLPEYAFLEQLYEKHWVDDWYKDKKEKEEYRQRGRQFLKTFFDDLHQQTVLPKYIEKRFDLPLDNYTFVGKIDRADTGHEGLAILDYKTGKAPKGHKDLDQLYIYQWAAQEFLHEKVETLTYWFLQGNQKIEEPIATPEEIEKVKAKLLEVIEQIVYATKHDLFKELHKKSPMHNCQFEHLE